VQLRDHSSAVVDGFVSRVQLWDEVVTCHALTGEMDYLLHVMVEDLEHFSRFLLDRLLNDAGVTDVNSSFVLREIKTRRSLPLDQLRER
jgi:Lrp/AsnC family leucine-responsive transcriptional regulator